MRSMLRSMLLLVDCKEGMDWMVPWGWRSTGGSQRLSMHLAALFGIHNGG